LKNPSELTEYLQALRAFEAEKRAESEAKLQSESGKKAIKKQKTADNRSTASLTAGQLGVYRF